MTLRPEVTGARRVVVKVGSSSLTTAARRHRPRPGAAPGRGARRPAHARGRGRPGLLGRHRRRAGPARVAAAPPGTARPAGRRLRGAGVAGAPVHRGARPARDHRRPGAADPRRRDPALALPQRLPDVRQAPRARGPPDRQRERHRGDHGDPVRRQRPARGPGRPPRARRPAGAAQRRRGPVRRPPGPDREHAGHRRRLGGRPRPGPDRPHRRRRGRDRRHADQGRGGEDRHRRGHPRRADLGRAGRPPRWPGSRSARCSTRPAAAGPPGCSGWPTPPSRRAACCSTPARCARSSSGAPRCSPPGSPA